MQNDLVAIARAGAPASSWSTRSVRITTAMFCAAAVAAGVAVNAYRYLNTGHHYRSVANAFAQQVQVLGLDAGVLVVVTLSIGLLYGRGLTRRLDISPQNARAAHVTLAVATVVTIGLHLGAIAASSEFAASAAKLLVPFVWNDRFPDPLAAGTLGLWLVAFFGLSLFVRGRLWGRRRWRLLHRVVLAGLALTILHSVLMAGWIPGWAM